MLHDSWVVIVVVVLLLDSIFAILHDFFIHFQTSPHEGRIWFEILPFFSLKKYNYKNKIWKKKKKKTTTINKKNLGIQILKVRNWDLWSIFYYIHYVYIKYVSSWRIWKWVWCIITQVPTFGGRKRKEKIFQIPIPHTYIPNNDSLHKKVYTHGSKSTI
jgi:hypothetical protein